MVKLLDTIDPAFGWIGVSYRFPSSWAFTPDEVADHIDRQANRGQALKFIIRNNRKHRHNDNA